MAQHRSTAQRDRDRDTIRRTHAPCWLCGQPIDYTLVVDYTLPRPHRLWFVVDHKIPLARGGADHISNKAAAHWLCNARKGSKTDGLPVLKRSGSLAGR